MLNNLQRPKIICVKTEKIEEKIDLMSDASTLTSLGKYCMLAHIFFLHFTFININTSYVFSRGSQMVIYSQIVIYNQEHHHHHHLTASCYTFRKQFKCVTGYNLAGLSLN